MFIYEELQALKKAILPWLYAFVLFSLFFFLFEFKPVNFSGYSLYVPVFSAEPIAAKVFLAAKNNILPEGVQLVVTEPLSGFVVTIGIAVGLSFVLTFPWLLRSLSVYIFEALYDHEKRIVTRAVLPAMFLFAAGIVFGYWVVLPPAFSILYRYATSLGAQNLFSLGEFAAFVFGITVACGVMFLMPVFIAGLNYAGVTDRRFWVDNWRMAFLIFLIVSAIITPDGSGITMLLLTAPLTGLYFVGSMIGAKEVANKK